MKASIIIPSYNASERLYYNLLTLNNQDHVEQQFEVIIIDNGSTDDTKHMLAKFQPQFPLTIVTINENKGISHGRNQGILRARGDILIFHDSDMLATRKYVKKHIEAHNDEDMVICGLYWRRVYSYYYHQFEDDQIQSFNKVAHLYSPIKKEEHGSIQLLTKEQIQDGSYQHYQFELENSFVSQLRRNLKEYGSNLAGYYCPWKYFITNNASVSRKKVFEVGLFDENFVRWGFEDYDLGFRLYRSGGRFSVREDIISIHQEHPRNYTMDMQMVNADYVCKKYNHIHDIVVILALTKMFDEKTKNDIVKDIHDLLKVKVKDCEEILTLFLQIIQNARKILNKQLKLEKIYKEMQDLIENRNLNQQLDQLHKKFKVEHFIRAFKYIIAFLNLNAE
ncbi:glycosyltransferase [Bacillus pacificus]|uniref:glycosyltransferase family 2 protein n=1 Tax=Bacillus pacificus TaxID=2026187 RepID=UPI003D1E0246